MNQIIFINSLEELQQVAVLLKNLMDSCKIFTFTGSLGAGKTTLIQLLLRQCNVKGPITSPTFTYVNVYHNDLQQTFYHFDLYRIKSVDDFIYAGFDEYFHQPNSWCFIEWPEVIAPLLTHNVCHVAIEYVHEGTRKIIIDS
jgi:tRNA threonylcarbamoyladenosine biosynthesis protein TsaE